MSPLFVLNSSTSCCSSEKSFNAQKCFGFPTFLSIWTLSNNDYMILRSIFSHRGQLRDSYATITEDSNAYWGSRRKNYALRARAWKLLLKQRENLFCTKKTKTTTLFNNSSPLLQRILENIHRTQATYTVLCQPHRMDRSSTFVYTLNENCVSGMRLTQNS